MIYAQSKSDSSYKPYSWLSAGLGASTSGVSLGAGYSGQVGRSGLISVRIIENTEISIFESPSEKIWDFGVLYGQSLKMSNGYATISTGISLVGGVNRGEKISGDWLSAKYRKVNFSTVGIPFEGQLFWTASPTFGIGIYIFTNINQEKSFYGALVCIRYGNLK